MSQTASNSRQAKPLRIIRMRDFIFIPLLSILWFMILPVNLIYKESVPFGEQRQWFGGFRLTLGYSFAHFMYPWPEYQIEQGRIADAKESTPIKEVIPLFLQAAFFGPATYWGVRIASIIVLEKMRNKRNKGSAVGPGLG